MSLLLLLLLHLLVFLLELLNPLVHLLPFHLLLLGECLCLLCPLPIDLLQLEPVILLVLSFLFNCLLILVHHLIHDLLFGLLLIIGNTPLLRLLFRQHQPHFLLSRFLLFLLFNLLKLVQLGVVLHYFGPVVVLLGSQAQVLRVAGVVVVLFRQVFHF